MTILATISPGSITIPAGDSFGPDSVRQKVVDVSAEDTMTNWALNDWSSASDARVYFQQAHCSTDEGMWQHTRLKWTGDAGLRIFYWDETKTKRMSINLQRGSCYGASIGGGSGSTVTFTPFDLNKWIDIDIEFKKTDGWRLFADGTQIASGDFAWPADCNLLSCTFAIPTNLNLTEGVISTTDTRGWRIQSEVPASMVLNGFAGDIAELQTLAPDQGGVSSTGVGSTAKFDFTAVPTDMNIAAVNFSTISDTSGATESPYLAQILEENGNRHFVGFIAVTADSEDNPTTFVSDVNPTDGSVWTPAVINASTLSVENVHYQAFSSAAVSGGYGLDSGGADWTDGTTMSIKVDSGARTVRVFNKGDDTVKYGTADDLYLWLWLDDLSKEFKGKVTWDGNGYVAATDDTNYNMVISAGINMAMTFVAL
ncbi:hypothetical protein CZP2022_70 [Vibrio phage C-ZP2022]|nr:hypothetical protein CZP2022_70 [Vibrio phage C-ZP2022]